MINLITLEPLLDPLAFDPNNLLLRLKPIPPIPIDVVVGDGVMTAVDVFVVFSLLGPAIIPVKLDLVVLPSIFLGACCKRN